MLLFAVSSVSGPFIQDMLGEEYEDHGLVIALDNGRPCESRIIEKRFSQLKEKAGLPNVVFHSLRHSSTTYKLKTSPELAKALAALISEQKNNG